MGDEVQPMLVLPLQVITVNMHVCKAIASQIQTGGHVYMCTPEQLQGMLPGCEHGESNIGQACFRVQRRTPVLL